MKITCLVENTSANPDLTPKHGLSLFIETRHHTLLFDMGPDATLLDNARKLGLDIAKVDLAVLSHGHIDHGGGIPFFQGINDKARIFMTRRATGSFHAKILGLVPKDIGLDCDAMDMDQCRFIASDMKISQSLQIFTGFDSQGFIPKGNSSLYCRTSGGKKQKDDFSHELALLITENNTSALFTGCSHSGIGNMLNTVLNRTGLTHIDHVIGGFHLFNPITKQTESKQRLDLLAAELSLHSRTRFYTGHCTGTKALAYLQRDIPVVPLSTGTVITP